VISKGRELKNAQKIINPLTKYGKYTRSEITPYTKKREEVKKRRFSRTQNV
jgi:hypothetical protein